MSSVTPKTAQRSGVVAFRLTARGGSSAGSHPRKSRSSSLATWREGRRLPWPARTRFTGPQSWPFSSATRCPDEGACLPPTTSNELSLSLRLGTLLCLDRQRAPGQSRDGPAGPVEGWRGHAQALASTTTAGVLSPLDWRRTVSGPWKHSPTRSPPGHSERRATPVSVSVLLGTYWRGAA